VSSPGMTVSGGATIATAGLSIASGTSLTFTGSGNVLQQRRVTVEITGMVTVLNRAHYGSVLILSSSGSMSNVVLPACSSSVSGWEIEALVRVGARYDITTTANAVFVGGVSTMTESATAGDMQFHNAGGNTKTLTLQSTSCGGVGSHMTFHCAATGASSNEISVTGVLTCAVSPSGSSITNRFSASRL